MSDIDVIRFDDAVPLETKATDESPITDDVLSCQECGVTLEYAGRGRKPKYCDAHRKTKRGSSGTRATPNDKLARQATEALVQLNRLAGFGVRVLGMSETGTTIAVCEDGFRDMAYDALITDPDLCRQILSAGQVSAKFSLAMAYATMGAMVGPVAMAELKEKRAAREERKKAENPDGL